MFERILVPLDGSKAAESVLPYVERLAFRAGNELILLHIIDPQVPLNHPDYGAFMRRPTQIAKKKAQEYLRGVAEGLQTARIPVAVRTIIGPAASRILSTAESQRAGLVAITSRGRGAGDTWPYGSIADRILHHSRVPVLLVRPGTEPESQQSYFQSLVVPLDGSWTAETALPPARELAGRLNVGIHMFQAVPTPWQARAVLGWDVMEEPAADVDPMQDGRDYLDRVAGALSQERNWADGTVVVGAAVPSILDFAREKEGTLIIMCTAGSRGVGARWRVGSVAERMIRHSEVPLLLVPPRLAPHLRREMQLMEAVPVGVPV